MTHSEITVTMSLKEYESMKAEIESLKKKNINNFIKDVYENDDLSNMKSAFVLDNTRLQAHYRKKVYLPGEEIDYEV